MLHTKRAVDQNIIESHANDDAKLWLMQADTEGTNVDILDVYDAANKGFFTRVNAAAPTNQYVDDRGLGRQIYNAVFIETVAVLLGNHRKTMAAYEDHMADLADAASY